MTPFIVNMKKVGNKLKLIALDMDGTLLSPEKHISQENINAIKKKQSQGDIVMICSGRAPEDIKQILNKYGLDCPLAGSNGTVLEIDSKILESVSMNREDVEEIAQKLDNEQIPYFIYTNQGIFAPDDWSDRVADILEHTEDLTEDAINDIKNVTEKPYRSSLIQFFSNLNHLFLKDHIAFNKFFILTYNKTIKEKLTSLLSRIPNITITTSGPTNIEIMHKDGHKGSGLKKAAEYYNIPLADTVAIGDSYNDIPMLEIAGLSIAMANADNKVKNICNKITLSNSENGVSHALNKLVE
ncbi:Cof-type HAD-IIB family hydrolase [Scopulibacillus cellulosilyticus]|uniref:Cof-type HAD-IIB family hydrolase n=1 Tax=Scopulibacillus cellulosilyticus TaxID=2665665 RepID=A0ABW2PZT8_9BACL